MVQGPIFGQGTPFQIGYRYYVQEEVFQIFIASPLFDISKDNTVNRLNIGVVSIVIDRSNN